MATKAHHEAEADSIRDELQDGKRTITFNPRGLSIVWGGDSRYWRLPDKLDQSATPAELIQVSWLEVTASTPRDLDTGKKYKIYFELSLKPDAFGWNGCQVYLMAKIGRKGRYKWAKVSLKDQPASQPFKVPSDDFTIEAPQTSSDDQKLYFGLYEVWSGKWKGGLQIHKAIVEEVRDKY